jgi:hypothetical protein
MYMYLYMYMCMYMNMIMYMYMFVHMYLYEYENVYVYVYVCIYIYINDIYSIQWIKLILPQSFILVVVIVHWVISSHSYLNNLAPSSPWQITHSKCAGVSDSIIPPETPLGHLDATDGEWSWVPENATFFWFTSCVFRWICARSLADPFEYSRFPALNIHVFWWKPLMFSRFPGRWPQILLVVGPCFWAETTSLTCWSMRTVP